jgi:hypothetical protein
MKGNKFDLFLIVLGLIVALGLYHKDTLEYLVHSQQNARVNEESNVWVNEEPNAWVNDKPNVGISKIGQLHYVGPINNKGYQLLKKLYSDYEGKKINRAIIIESRGGDAFAGLRIASFIKAKKLSVKIPTYCFGACAQYIFPAAAFKYLEKNALVGFSEPLIPGTLITFEDVLSESKVNANKLNMGSDDFIQTDTSDMPEECVFHPELAETPAKSEEMIQNTTKLCFNILNRQTTYFYNKLHVDSKLLEIGLTKLRQAKKSNEEIQAFYYDPESLKALGLNRVIFPNQWIPQDNPEYQHMIEIKLSDW